jgi:hypothetical protein
MRLRSGLLACVLLVAACGTQPPSAQTSPLSPVVICDQMGWDRPVPLRCEAAIDAALGALPANSLPVSRIEFHWGDYLAPGRLGCFPNESRGTVIFTFQTGASAYVGVAADDRGRVTVTSELLDGENWNMR